MEIGDKISRVELTELGWELVKELLKCSCEIWEKGTQRLMWRVKTETIYTLWNKERRKR